MRQGLLRTDRPGLTCEKKNRKNGTLPFFRSRGWKTFRPQQLSSISNNPLILDLKTPANRPSADLPLLIISRNREKAIPETMRNLKKIQEKLPFCNFSLFLILFPKNNNSFLQGIGEGPGKGIRKIDDDFSRGTAVKSASKREEFQETSFFLEKRIENIKKRFIIST